MVDGKKILVIDDTELIRMIYRDRLGQEGYAVILASDGVAGVQSALAEKPDLILLDLVMPRQNGLDTLKQLKDDPRTQAIPVIILSNRDDDEEIKSGMRLGAEDYLKKTGSSPAEVTDKIKAILDRSPADGAAAAIGSPGGALKVCIRDHEGDADALVAVCGLSRRFWCPACEQELVLELVPDASAQGGHWFKARLICASCAKPF